MENYHNLDYFLRRYPENWNIYAFQCSDGDNWPDDTDHTCRAIEKLKSICQLVGYCEIEPSGEKSNWASDWKLSTVYKKLLGKNFKLSKISSKSDIWKAFLNMFSKRVTVAK